MRNENDKFDDLERDDLERDNLEPDVDADSDERLAEELPEPPHAADHFDAGTGQGTATNVSYDERFQERPILDGSTQDDLAEATVPNPTRGEVDPALITKQPALNTTSTSRFLYASIIAGSIMLVVLLLLLRFNQVLAGIGIAVVLIGLLLVLAVRASRVQRPARLRLEAVLLSIIWVVPLAMFITIMFVHIAEIQSWLGWW